MFVARQSTPPTMSIAMFQDMGSAVEDNHRKFPIVLNSSIFTSYA